VELPSPYIDLIDVYGEHSPEDLLKQSILQTYHIADDSRRLKRSPNDFEYYRDHYPVRREFNHYKVNYTSSGTGLENQLSGLGFTTQPI
jgi:erythronate-4-phosphate dehydrogenase